MHILRAHLNSDVSQVACPLFFYTPLAILHLNSKFHIPLDSLLKSASIYML